MSTIDRVAALQERLSAAVEDLVSGEDWAAMLAAAACFHHYSVNNVLLIRLQCPEATRVAGYRAWQALGRQVRKGEKGIAILAPCVFRRRELTEEESAAKPELAKVLRGFTVVHIFDETQTDGTPVPDVRPALLEGEAAAELWAGLEAQVVAAGFRLERGPCSGANGCTDFGSQTVTVRADVGDGQAAKTLAHELAHVLLHDTSRVTDSGDLAEVEAESVAYVVCQAAGMTTSEYSLPYVARWSGGDVTKVRATVERVVDTARQVVDALGLGDADGAETAA